MGGVGIEIEGAEVIQVEVKVLMSIQEIKQALFKRSANIAQGMIHLNLVAGIVENQEDLTHDHDQDQDLEIVAKIEDRLDQDQGKGNVAKGENGNSVKENEGIEKGKKGNERENVKKKKSVSEEKKSVGEIENENENAREKENEEKENTAREKEGNEKKKNKGQKKKGETVRDVKHQLNHRLQKMNRQNV